ncbi:ATP-binding cassette domain-containing protein [Sulfitobacter sp. M22]|nr:ATP-binding cassette domain-containing protein [Sulfitobacter sp. M22]
MSAFASAAMVGSVMPFLSVLSNPSEIADTPLLAWAYTRFGFTSSYAFLVALGLGALIVIALALAIQMLKIYGIARFAMMRVHCLSYRLMARYLGQPYEYFLDRHSGDMGTRILAEAGEVVNRFLRPMTELITSTLTIAALVGFLLWVEPLVAVAAFSVFGGIYGFTYAFSRMKLRQLGIQRVEANKERYRLATEALGGVKEIKLLGRERAYVDRFCIPSHRMARAQTRIQVLSQMPTYVIQGVALGGVVMLCLLLVEGDSFADGNALTTLLPILGVFAFAGQRMMPELSKFYRSATEIQSGIAAVDSVHADLVGDATDMPRDMPAPLGLKRALEFTEVSYRYPQAEHAGVIDISLKIHAGEKIGIVGSTGAGKTTLADVVLGLLRPLSGELTTDGTPIHDANLRAWQQTVGYVPQDIFLTDANVAENIALGIASNQIDMNRVSRSAQLASIDTFIRNELPMGYDTTVGERGVRLSGGQRQRIGIARALYHDADLIVFDEATSALDNQTEAEVMAAIDALPGDKTVLMIAHRLSTVKHCDRIIVMERGRVVGCDRWDTLMATNAAFQRIAKLSDAS